MIESMQKRASPVNAHKVATQYFDNFRKERQIPEEPEKTPSGEGAQKIEGNDTSAVSTAVDTTVITAVENEHARKPARKGANSENTVKTAPLAAGAELEDTHGKSELKVYMAMYTECRRKKTDSGRFGLKQLRGMTGLSDKTVRVSIHALEEKLNIETVEPSLGVYGRKFRVYSPEEVKKRRANKGVRVDPATKRIERRRV